MPRDLNLTTLEFGSLRILMESILDPWGEDDPIVGDVLRQGFDENKTLSYWAYLARSAQPNDLFVDVGAYAGLFALVAAKSNPHIKVAAFEAATVTYARLVRNIILNQVETLICAAHFAAWDEMKALEFGHRYGIYSMCPGETAMPPETELDHFESVLSLPLDRLCSKSDRLPGTLGSRSLGIGNFQRVAAIKIDVEGAELNVLNGAVHMLKEERPHILCEILSDTAVKTLTDFISKYNYEVHTIGGERNFHLVPVEKVESFGIGYAAWSKMNGGDSQLTASRALQLRLP